MKLKYCLIVVIISCITSIVEGYTDKELESYAPVAGVWLETAQTWEETAKLLRDAEEFPEAVDAYKEMISSYQNILDILKERQNIPESSWTYTDKQPYRDKERIQFFIKSRVEVYNEILDNYNELKGLYSIIKDSKGLNETDNLIAQYTKEKSLLEKTIIGTSEKSPPASVKKKIEASPPTTKTEEVQTHPEQEKESWWSGLFKKKTETPAKPIERYPTIDTGITPVEEEVPSETFQKESWWSKFLKRKPKTEDEIPPPPRRVKTIEPVVAPDTGVEVTKANARRTWVDSMKDFFRGKKEVLKKKKTEGTLGTVNLPYESQLRISGRKTIAASLKNTVYTDKIEGQDPNQQSGGLEPTIEQQLQVRVEGRIGAPNEDHININVQFDDAQQNANKQKIDISYTSVPRGTPVGDVTFIAQFGDIAFNLPNTRYLIFNKSLFGLKGTLDINNFDLLGIKANHVNIVTMGSRTKGKSGLKQFRGDQLLEPSIRDIRSDQFVRGIYRLEVDTSFLPLKSVTIWLDDINGSNDETKNASQMTVQSANGENYTGNFHLLTTNEDYILDLERGIVQFRRPPGQEEVVAVKYTRVNGAIIGDPTHLMIQDNDPTDTFYLQYQLRNVYSIGTQNLNIEDPNFKVEIRNKATLDIRGPNAQTYLQIFGLDRNFDNKIDPEFVNFSEGLVDFRGLDYVKNPFGDTTPFDKTIVPTDSDAIIYTRRKLDTVEDQIDYIIHIEYESKLDAILLSFNIVENSDIVSIDGVQAQRGIDYFIDYDVGLITIFNKDLIKPNSTVRIDYEYMPFGGGFEKTLLGAGANVNVNSNLSWGVSALGELGGTVNEQPDLRSAPEGKFVWDANVNIRPLHSLVDLVNRFKSKPMSYNLVNTLNLNMSGEIAQSDFDPNSFGSAAISDMEDIQDEVQMSMDDNAWLSSSPPTYPDSVASQTLTIGASQTGKRANSTFDNEGGNGFGHPDDDERDEEKSLKWTIEFNDPAETEWSAIRHVISNTFTDLSRHNTIEFWLYPDGISKEQFVNAFEVFVDIGVISEDANQNGALDLEDRNKDGILNDQGEDEGFDQAQPNLSGGHNGILDAEDLNNDDRLQTEEFFFTYGDLNLKSDTFVSDASFPPAGWIRYRIGLGKLIAYQNGASQPDIQLIKHIRVWIRERQPNSWNGSINLYSDYLSILGNTWVDDDDKDSILVTTVNTVNNINYRGFFDDVKMFKNFRREVDEDMEQSLAIVFTPQTDVLMSGDSESVSASLIVPDPTRSYNISRYSALIFYVQHRLVGGTEGIYLTLRFGDDDNNYFQWQRNLDANSSFQWDTVYVDLNELSKNLLEISLNPDSQVVVSSDSPELLVRGSPTLGSVDFFKFIVTNKEAFPANGEVWLNELHVEGSRKVKGRASTGNISMGYKDYGSVSGSISKTDGQFKGVGILQDNVQDENLDKDVITKTLSTNLAAHKILWFPAKLGFNIPVNYSVTLSESKVDTDQGIKNAVTNVSQMSVDKSEVHSVSTSLNHKWIPSNSLSFSHSDNFTNYIFRGRQNQRTFNDIFNGSTGYSYTFPKKLFKIIPTGKNLSVGSNYSYSRSRRFLQFDRNVPNLSDTNADQNDKVLNSSHTSSFNMNIVPFNFIRMSPTFSYRQSMENSRLFVGMKNRSRAFTLPIDLNRFMGIKPNLNLTGNLTENFSQVTNTDEKRKSVSAQAGFNLSSAIFPAQIHRWLRFFDANYNYRVDVSSSYSNFPVHPGRKVEAGGLGKDTVEAIWDDYFKYKYFPLISRRNKTDIETSDTDISKFRNSASTVVNHSFSGGVYTWRPLSTRYTLSFIRNESAQTASVSTTFARNWGLNFNLATQQAFKIFQRWFTGSNLTGNVSSAWNRSASSLNTSISPNYNFNLQFGPSLSLVHQFNYSVSRAFNIEPDPENTKKLSERMIPTQRTATMSPSFRTIYTINKPFSLKFPLFGKVHFTNQFQVNSSLAGSWNRVFQPETDSEDPKSPKFKATANTLKIDSSLGASYRVRSNLTVDFSGSYGRFWNWIKKADNNYSYGVSSRVEWRF